MKQYTKEQLAYRKSILKSKDPSHVVGSRRVAVNHKWKKTSYGHYACQRCGFQKRQIGTKTPLYRSSDDSVFTKLYNPCKF